MITILSSWYQRHFSNPQTVVLAFMLLVGLATVIFLNGILAPVFTAIIFAYLLDGLVVKFETFKMPRFAAASLVFLIFIASVMVLLFVLVPVMSRQLHGFIQELPVLLVRLNDSLQSLPAKYPEIISASQINDIITALSREFSAVGQAALSLSLASLTGFVSLVIYLVLVPFMVLFMLKDKKQLLAWFGGFLPDDMQLVRRVWVELDKGIASYIRGKALEILIIWAAAFTCFKIFGLHYPVLLSMIVGLSVLIPYVGAALATLPVAVVAYFQWGFEGTFYSVLIAYAILQFIDGNILVPLLFSEVVNLHPVAIIIAVLFFGGIWGLWGVFFAIPLATLIQAVINAWPKPIAPKSSVI